MVGSRVLRLRMCPRRTGSGREEAASGEGPKGEMEQETE